jgi:hypothetical protein
LRIEKPRLVLSIGVRVSEPWIRSRSRSARYDFRSSGWFSKRSAGATVATYSGVWPPRNGSAPPVT